VKTVSWPFWLVIVSLFAIFLSPELLSDGMFMDGLIYAAVAKNMAHGVGSFWSPHFSETAMTPFHEHPPLALGLQALFFKVLGDGRWTERLFSLLAGVALIVLIRGLWRWAVPQPLRRTAWLPVFLWFTVQLVYWSIGNNMLENMVSLFCGLGVFLYLRAPLDRTRSLWLLGSGLAVTLGCLSKGPVALFPLAVPLLARLTLAHRTWRETVADQVWLLAGAIIPAAAMLALSHGARSSLTAYWNVQVLHSLSSVQTVSSRWAILDRLVRETLPMVMIAGTVALVAFRFSFSSLLVSLRRPALFFLVVGLSASLPITISLKQNGFYLVPSFMFFALGWALWIGPAVAHWTGTLRPEGRVVRSIKSMGMVLAAVAVVVASFQINRVGRDRDVLRAVYDSLEVIPARCRINICTSLFQSWSLHGYYARYAFVSLERNMDLVHPYLLSDGTCRPAGDSGFTPVPISSTGFQLYRLSEGVTIYDQATDPGKDGRH